MSVYDTATKLASEIKNSKEYKDFIYNMKVMKMDKDNEILLSEYKKTGYSLQYATMNNKKIDKKSMRKMEEIQNKIRYNEKIYNYILAEEKFNKMMDNINKVIAQAIKEDYK
ncbi:YlbF family regulator [Terrisporobacter petrolearius]|uniref:YlbF family regulator n=1 Tax=Terrisporobacter petrolearius TaxID=1460447 RepID=UPI0031CCA9BD